MIVGLVDMVSRRDRGLGQAAKGGRGRGQRQSRPSTCQIAKQDGDACGSRRAERVMRDRTARRRRLAASDPDAQGDGMALARRTVVWWWLSVVGALCVLLLAYVIMWY